MIPRIIDHLTAAIERAQVFDKPFSHFYMVDCFPSDIYAQMISHFPGPKSYSDPTFKVALREDGTKSRRDFKFTREELSGLNEEARSVWYAVSESVLSTQIRKCFFKKVGKDMAKRYGIHPEELDQIQAYPSPILYRDLPRYKTEIHADTISKIANMHLYLPQDLSQRDLGTSIYSFRLGAVSAVLHRWGVPGQFRKVKTFEFQPNSGYGFGVSKNSWHAREVIKSESGVRNSLMVNYYQTSKTFVQ